MAIPTQLGVEFTPTEVTDMKAAAQLITDTIRSKIDFNMSNEERDDLSSVKEGRLPYVLKSVSEYGVTYPHLNGLAYPHAMADKDMKVYGIMFEVLTLMEEATERAVELRQLAGHFGYKFMRGQYRNAEAYRAENVPGAQVVYDGLKACFEGQGPQGDGDAPTEP